MFTFIKFTLKVCTLFHLFLSTTSFNMWFRFFQVNVITFVMFVLNLGFVSRILDLKTMKIEVWEETVKEMNVAYWSQVYCNCLYFVSLSHWIYPESLVSVTQNAKKTSVLYDCLHYGIYIFELDISLLVAREATDTEVPGSIPGATRFSD
jgi:hypothetical protein